MKPIGSIQFGGFYFVDGHPDKVFQMSELGIVQEADAGSPLEKFDAFHVQSQELEELVGRYDGQPHNTVKIFMTDDDVQTWRNAFNTLFEAGGKKGQGQPPPHVQEFTAITSALYARCYLVMKHGMDHAMERMSDLKQTAVFEAGRVHDAVRKAVEQVPLPRSLRSAQELENWLFQDNLEFSTGDPKRWQHEV